MEEQQKFCGGCKTLILLINFSKNQSQCKSCKKNLANNDRKKHPEKFKEIDKENNLKKKEILLNTDRKCEKCNIVKNLKLFNYPYDDSIKVCKECIKNKELEDIKDLKEIHCPLCDTIKTVENFSKNASKKNGYASLCKDCFMIINTEYRINNPEKSNRSQRTKLWYMSDVTCDPLTFFLQQNYYKRLLLQWENRTYKSHMA